MAPEPKPTDVPDTTTLDLPPTCPRLPEIERAGDAGACGVKASESVDQAPQPAPLRARTRAVYVVPLLNPEMVHEKGGDDVRQLRPPGEAVAW